MGQNGIVRRMTFNLDHYWNEETADHMAVAQQSFAGLRGVFGQCLDVCERAIRDGGKILFFGNGGSAADAQHLATELTVRFIKDRPAIAAIALTTDSSTITAIGNDLGLEHLFARQIEAIGKPGDVAIGLSTSGTSPNIITALKTARENGLLTIGLGGRDGGKLPETCDLTLIVPAQSTRRIQEMHITLGHMLCGALELRLGLV